MHINNIKIYPAVVNRLYINPVNNKRYVFFYLSENMLLDYFLSISNAKYLRYAFVPNNPKFRLVLNQDIVDYFRQYNIKAVNNLHTIPSNQNFIIDLNLVLFKLRNELHISNPLQLRNWLTSYFKWITQEFLQDLPNTEKVFIYGCDLYGEPYSINLMYRNIGALLPVLLEEPVVQYFLVLFKTRNKTQITSLITPSKKFDSKSITLFIRNRLSHRLHQSLGKDDEPQKPGSDKAEDDTQSTQGDKKLDDITIKISTKTLEPEGDKIDQHKTDGSKIITTVTSIEKIQGERGNDKDTKPSDDSHKGKRIKNEEGLKSYPDQIKYETVAINNLDPIFKRFDFTKIYDNQNFSAIFKKRIIDFQENFEKQMEALFKTLENQPMFPLKLVSIMKRDNQDPVKINNVNPSYYIDYIVKLKDEDLNKVFEIKISVPKIFENGYFIINGHKKYLIYQLVRNPITFERHRNEGKFASLYAVNIITHTRNTFYLYISGVNVPLIFVLLAFFDLDTIANKFGFSFKTVDNKSINENEINIPLKNNEYLVLFDLSPVSKLLLHPLIHLFKKEKLHNIESINQFFLELLIKKSGDTNINYKIESVLRNICDIFTVDILKYLSLPTNILDIYLYICKGILEKRDTKQNDLRYNRLRSSEAFIHQLVKHVFSAYSKYFSNRLNNIDTEYHIDTSISFKNVIESRAVSMLEYINPIEELSCLSRFSFVGGLGAIQDEVAVRDEIRNIHDSYYGNVDPMDTPEGSKIGVLNYLTSKALISQKYGLFGIKNEVNSFSELLSISTSLSPFIKHCDGPRIMFASLHVKQAIPLITSEPPCVQTGYEYLIPALTSSTFIKRSTLDGRVIQANQDYVIIQDEKNPNRVERINMKDQYVLSGQGFKILNTFHLCVKTHDKVKRGDIVAYSNTCKNGVLSLGLNVLTAIMFWKGYTFEDGYVISESLAKRFSTFRYNEIKLLIHRDEKIHYIAHVGDTVAPGHKLLERTMTDDSYWSEWDDIINNNIITYTPGGEIIDIEIYPGKRGLDQEKHALLIPLYEQFKTRFEVEHNKPLESIQHFGDVNIWNYIVIIFKIKTFISSLSEGDKISNRHGGKGCIAYIEKDENMPVTPWGERIELILNPLSVINRMNVSTILDLYTGLVSSEIIKKVRNMSINKGKQYILDIIQMFDTTKDKRVVNTYKYMLGNVSDKDYLAYIQNNKFFPIIVSHDTTLGLNDMLKILHYMGLKDAYYVHLPELNKDTERPVAIGYLYYMQLEHIAQEKLSARSTGLTSKIFKQPVKGRKLTGGQRVGEYDSYSLLSHGCENALKEIYTALSDDVKAKNSLLSNILDYGSTKMSQIKTTPTKDVFSIYLHGIMLEEDIYK